MLEPVPRLMKKEFTWPAVSQKLRNAVLDDFKLEDVDRFMYLVSVVNSENSVHNSDSHRGEKGLIFVFNLRK